VIQTDIFQANICYILSRGERYFVSKFFDRNTSVKRASGEISLMHLNDFIVTQKRF